MKIFICASKHFYDRIPPIKAELEDKGHVLTMPNSYDDPFKEEEVKKLSKEDHIEWKAQMIRDHEPKIRANDAILVLNFEKKGVPNYIGGATFLEIFEAWKLGRKVFLYNNIPENIFTDELVGINPVVINGDLSRIN